MAMHLKLDRKIKIAVALLCVSAGAYSHAASQAAPPATSKLVFPAPDGSLIYYAANARGDIIPDFSNCGYGGGGRNLPVVPVKITVSPDADDADDLPRLQAAVDAVSRLPLRDGARGAVLLKKGRYQVGGTLRIAAGGVVLRGEGQGENGSVLVATQRRQHNLIEVRGVGKPQEVAATRQPILDDYVPVGARSFRVGAAARFHVGDAVIVHRPSTAAWIGVLGMDRIPIAPGGGTVQWAPGSKDLRFERVITAIRGDRISIDAPLVNALQKEFGGGSVYRYEFAGRIKNVGIEKLRGESEFDASVRDGRKKNEFADEGHGWNFIRFDAVRDGWVRDVTSRYFGYSCVNIGSQARSITVQDSQCLDPVSRVEGGRRYSFLIAGQLNLVQRCLARAGRHDFVLGAAVPGPNVFLDCTAQGAYTDSGPHQRWATGTLFDRVTTDNAINVQNRGNSGTGHGWTGSQMVLWNCRAGSIDCRQPPISQNYAIGCVVNHPSGDGYWESVGQPVSPSSLYLRQLQDRLGKRAVENIAPEKPSK